MEENRLRDLSHFKPLPSLERLYLGLNRIQDYNQLEKLHDLHDLVELSVMGNSVSQVLLLFLIQLHTGIGVTKTAAPCALALPAPCSHLP